MKYCLKDFVDVNCETHSARKPRLVRELLKKSEGNNTLTLLSCIAIGNLLIVVKGGHPKTFKELYVLDSSSEEYRTFRVK